MTEVILGKITHASYGFGGYDDAQFGFSLTFSLAGGSGVGTFHGTWATYPKNAEYTQSEWNSKNIEAFEKVKETLTAAKVKSVAQLVGIPVEIVIESGMLLSWRVLTEVL